MEQRNYRIILLEMLTVIIVPFVIVLFTEFVLRFGMGPFTERLSYFFAITASLISICMYVWIERGIAFSMIPVLISAIILSIFYMAEESFRFRFFYFFVSILVLAFGSILTYSISKVSKKSGISHTRSIIIFFTGLVIFIAFLFIVDVFFSFLSPRISIVQGMISGVRTGLILGSGVSIVTLILSQRVR
jgi:hypothetical protein